MPVQVWTKEQLTAWREAMGWKRPKAAAELGMTVRSLERLEAGEYNIDVRTTLACMWLQADATVNG